MVKAAPELNAPENDAAVEPHISPTRGGAHPGHALGFLVAAQLAPFVGIVLALGLLSGGAGSLWSMWFVGAVIAVPAALVFFGSVFLAEHGLEVE